MITPAYRLLVVSMAWLLLGAAVAMVPSLAPAWRWLGIAAAGVALLDAVLAWWARPLAVSRRLPGRFALGQSGEVTLTLRNEGNAMARIDIFDGIPQRAVAEALPWSGNVPPQKEIRVIYPVKLVERGEAVFGPAHVRRQSPLGLWMKTSLHLSPEIVKGSSRDFHQLRDYRDGDPLAQIDWKATSRRQTLISRDYQEQRDQSVVFLLDTGRRMRALDGGVPQFDHILNAVLLVAHVALRQGDQVAVKSFGGTDRWLPPMKGSHAMPVLLNHLYDYQTTPSPSDFSWAVEKLMARQRRRSLVILLTNLRGEDGKELLPALQVLNSRHLVMLASMREGAVQEAFSKPVESFSSALRYLAADRYVQERREILASLGASGILTLDSTASEFPVRLANSYFDIKAAGRL
jgi:uncharacterized protein (DUF58 family)